MIPKFKYGEKVTFNMYGHEYIGTIHEIHVFDRDFNGSVDDIFYNIEVQEDKYHMPILYKNVPEKNISK